MKQGPRSSDPTDAAILRDARRLEDFAVPKGAGLISSQIVVAITITLMLAAAAIAIFVPYFLRVATLGTLERASLDLAGLYRMSIDTGDGASRWTIQSHPGENMPMIRLIRPEKAHVPGEIGMDDFQVKAWIAIENDGNAVFTRLETRNGKRVLRLAVADVAAKPSAVLEVSRIVEPDLAAAESISSQIFWWRVGMSSLVVGVLLWLSFQTRKRVRQHADLFSHVSEMAYIDGMTGLLNRSRFMDLAQQMADKKLPYSIYMIDIDRFKEVNDEFGHRASDDLIREVANRLRAIASPGDMLARLGGDEFILAAPATSGSRAPQDVAAEIVETLSLPMQSGNHRLTVSASVGCAFSSPERQLLDQIIIDADEALYRAKQSGRGRFEFFTAKFQHVRHERRALEKLLLQATSRRAFEYYYQPVVDANSGRVKSFEVLLRLRDSEGNFLPPSTFIPVAEEMKLICDIGEQVMRAAITFAAAFPSDIAININLSPRQFSIKENHGRTIAETLQPILEETGIDPARVVLEMTESALLSDSRSVIAQLEAIKALGVRTAIDDFGSGYSSLSYLWKFSFDVLKIDQSFARGLNSSTGNLPAIVRSIVNLARSLKVEIVAEGVETTDEARFFRDCGCDALQGYLFSRPIPAPEVAAYLLADAGQTPWDSEDRIRAAS